jgi:hypothetical protein
VKESISFSDERERMRAEIVAAADVAEAALAHFARDSMRVSFPNK